MNAEEFMMKDEPQRTSPKTHLCFEFTNNGIRSIAGDHFRIVEHLKGKIFSRQGGTFYTIRTLNSSLASFPANNRMAFSPPGCSGKNLVTFSTWPFTTTQMSSFVVCFATSSRVYSPEESFSSALGSLFFPSATFSVAGRAGV